MGVGAASRVGRGSSSANAQGSSWSLTRLAPPHGAWIAAALYLIAALLLLGKALLPHPGNTVLGGGTDPALFLWGYRWYPYAIGHGINPFWAHSIYAPEGADIAQATMVMGPAIVSWPVTALVGPVISFDLSEMLAPALAAFTTFLLCRRLIAGAPRHGDGVAVRAVAYREAFVPALIGGWLFGFSSYMFGELVGHEQLTIVFFVPAALHLALRAWAGELRRRWAVLWLALCLIGQFSVGEEVFATFSVFVVIGFVVAWLLADAEARRRLRGLAVTVIVAYVATVIVVSPYLHYSLMAGGEPVSYARNELISGDLLGLVVPTPFAALLGHRYGSDWTRFTAGAIEGGNYLSIPLIVLFAVGVAWGWRRRALRGLLVMAVITLMLSLGPYLHIDGHRIIALPWWLAERLPLLGEVLPSRQAMYLWLVVAVAVSLTLASARGARALLAGGLAALSLAALWPAVGIGAWHSTPSVPRLFSTAAYERIIPKGANVMIMPAGGTNFADLWQADTDFRFNLVGGYVLPAEAPNAYGAWAIDGTLTGGAAVPNAVSEMAGFIAYHHPTIAIMDDENVAGSPLPGIMRRLGWSQRHEYGALVMRAPHR